mmetsp:Transcript_35239/g.112065  ORF Transcript_35239/g.112065 Transcript_35239/m.112065 type:complete len:215 (-) Transcript_35239:321-965(-)
MHHAHGPAEGLVLRGRPEGRVSGRQPLALPQCHRVWMAEVRLVEAAIVEERDVLVAGAQRVELRRQLLQVQALWVRVRLAEPAVRDDEAPRLPTGAEVQGEVPLKHKVLGLQLLPSAQAAPWAPGPRAQGTAPDPRDLCALHLLLPRAGGEPAAQEPIHQATAEHDGRGSKGPVGRDQIGAVPRTEHGGEDQRAEAGDSGCADSEGPPILLVAV